MKKINSNPLSRTYVLLAGILIFITGCSKSEGPGSSYNVIDKNNFFTITFSGKSYTSYGWHESDMPAFSGGPFSNYEYCVDTTTGDTTWIHWFTVIDHATNNIPPKEVGNCNGIFKITRKGSMLGVYTLVKGPRANNKLYDLDGKSYFMEQGGEQFILTSRSASNYLEGTFQCNLLEVNGSYTTPIPATGSFRVR